MSQPMSFSWRNVHTHSKLSVSLIVPLVSLCLSLSLHPICHLPSVVVISNYTILHTLTHVQHSLIFSYDCPMLCVEHVVTIVTIYISRLHTSPLSLLYVPRSGCKNDWTQCYAIAAYHHLSVWHTCTHAQTRLIFKLTVILVQHANYFSK